VSNKVKRGKIKHSKVRHSKVKHSKVKHSKVRHSKVKHSKVKHSKAKASKVKHSKVKHSKAKASKVKHNKAKASKVKQRKAKLSKDGGINKQPKIKKTVTKRKVINNQKIFPSVMAQDQKELNFLLKKYQGLAKTLHLDVVDGKFAANHSLDFDVKLSTKFNYNAHLMMNDPLPWIKKNLRRVEMFILPFEAITSHAFYIQWMQKLRKPVAFSLLPKTGIEHLKVHLQDIDYILILTVKPGFYGSDYLDWPLKKIAKIKKINPKIKIIVDGHMDPNTIKEAKSAGGDYFVSGSFISKSDSPSEAMELLNKSR
jgi:ribulose-phosphate 3-epimerase